MTAALPGRQQAQPAQLVPVAADAEAVVLVVRAQPAVLTARQARQQVQLVPVGADVVAHADCVRAVTAISPQLWPAARVP